MCIKDLLLSTKSAAMANTYGRMKITTSANLLTDSRKVPGSGKITAPMMSIKASTTTTEETEKVSTDGAMETFTMDNSETILEKALVKWFGPQDKYIRVPGKTVFKMALPHCTYSMVTTRYLSESQSLSMESKWKRAKISNL